MSDWQPIETAPKDGTEILLWGGGSMMLGFWNKRSGGWDDGDYRSYERWPTHWRPRPEPPEVT